jgi:hypothetical protein
MNPNNAGTSNESQTETYDCTLVPPNNFDGTGLFSYFRSQSRYENPQQYNLLKVTASSTWNSNHDPSHVLNWNSNSSWKSAEFRAQWIQIDLLNLKFVLTNIAIIPVPKRFAPSWVLLGSNGNIEPNELIYESKDDPRFNSSKVVSIALSNTKPFTKFRILATNALAKEDQHPFEISSIEFFGKPFDNQPNQRLMIQYWNQFSFAQIKLPQRIDFHRMIEVEQGLIHFLRCEAKEQNPATAGLIDVTASTVDAKNVAPNILDWGTQSSWQSLSDKPNQWITIDLKTRSFMVKGFSIYLLNPNVPTLWALRGSLGNDDWTELFAFPGDGRTRTDEPKVIYFPVSTLIPCTKFQFYGKAQNWNGNFSFAFCSLEFYGSLITD